MTLNEKQYDAADRLTGSKGGAIVQMPGVSSAFGELITVEPTPQVQLKFPYNLNGDLAVALHNHISSTDAVSAGVFTLTLNGSASNFSSMKTFDAIRYGPGQGALFRGTCAFTTGIANSWQMFGCGSDDEGFNFGYDETTFGIQHRAHGSIEIRTLTITSGADADGGDFVITIDGDPVTITVAANDTISEVCAAIIAADVDNFHYAGNGWHVHTDDNVSIEFISFRAENAAGTFSFADTNSGVTAGTFNQATTAILGVAPTTNIWTAQADWNVDKMLDGTGPSGHTLDPTKLNVYQVQFQYLGAGAIEFFIENPASGDWQLVHRIKYAGTSTAASLRNPSLQLGMITQTNASYTGGNIVMKTASMAGFIQGMEADAGLRHSAKGTKTTTGTTPLNILTIHNEIDWQGQINRVEVYPDRVAVASEAGKTVTVDLISNPTEVGGAVSLTPVDANTSVMEYDTAGTTIVGGEIKESFIVTGVETKWFDMRGTGLRLRPGDRWVFAASLSSGSDAPVTVTVTWRERI